MSDRLPVPAPVKRQLLLEAGHRCTVCGTQLPLETAHIIPWHQTKEHRPEDLICLCANCHERADKEKWGAKALRWYKQHPWVLRVGQAEPVGNALVSRVEECAGLLAESLSGGWLRGMSRDEAFGLLRELLVLRGQLRKNAGLVQALRDFENTVGWLLHNEGGFDSAKERGEILHELGERYQSVLEQAAPDGWSQIVHDPTPRPALSEEADKALSDLADDRTLPSPAER